MQFYSFCSVIFTSKNGKCAAIWLATLFFKSDLTRALGCNVCQELAQNNTKKDDVLTLDCLFVIIF